MNIERQLYNGRRGEYDTINDYLEYWIRGQFQGIGFENKIDKLVALVSTMAARMAEADQLTAREIADAIDDSGAVRHRFVGDDS